MLRSKFILIAILGTMLLALAACTPKKADEANTNGNQLVYVDRCGGQGEIIPVRQDDPWKYPHSALLHFYACIKDTPTNKDMRGQTFEVEDMSSSNHTHYPAGTSDKSGCIKWDEPLEYNSLASHSATIEFKRKIIAPGIKAYDVATYYVNPWALGNESRDVGVKVDCGKTLTAPSGVIHADDRAKQKAFLSGDRDRDGADLWISTLSVKILNRQRYADGQVLDFSVGMKPFITVYDQAGMQTPQKLTSGKFAVFAHLVAEDAGPDQDEKLILTVGEMSTYATVDASGEIHTTLRTNLERRTPLGNVAIALRLIPVGDFGGQMPLKSYEAIYELGDINRLTDTNGTLTPACANRDKKNCNMLNFLSDAQNFQRFKDSRLLSKNEPLFFSTMKLRFVTIAPDETATRRTVTYSASTCISDRRTGARMARTPFYIEYEDDPSDKDGFQKQTLMTDDEGCLRWLGHVTHEYYRPEQFIPKKVKIQMIGPSQVTIHPSPYVIPLTEFDKLVSKGEANAGVDPDDKDKKGKPLEDPQATQKTQTKPAAYQELQFILNPWDDKFTFGFDLREVSKDFYEQVNKRPKPESRFFTGGYGYHTIRFLYDFDRYMQMQVKKTILLEVDPRVLRYSGIVNARKTTENLRDGIYLLKVGIQKSFLDPATAGISIYMNPQKPGSECIKKDPNGPCLDRETTPEALAEVPKRQYVTTKTALVRVVDGRLIKPIELTIRDLRLMRLRSNFLIELETIDERDLALNDIVKKYYHADLEDLNKERDTGKCRDEQKCYDQWKKDGKYPSNYDEMVKTQQQRKEASTAKWRAVYKKIDQEILKPSSSSFLQTIGGLDLGDGTPEEQKTSEQRQKEQAIRESLTDDISKMSTGYDFTKQSLPDCDHFDCEQFVENDGIHTYPEGDSHNNGLKPRTFVGPVIFLSNAYSDAVRATDNLDEVCVQDNPFLADWQRKKIDDPDDRLEASVYKTSANDVPKAGVKIAPGEDELFAIQNEPGTDIPETLPRGVNPDGSEAVHLVAPTSRENKSYRYSSYFNAQSHLCYQSFDDDPRDDQYHIPHKGLKTIEREQNQEYVNRMPKVAALPNFVANYNMDFAVLNKDNADEYGSDQNAMSPQEIAVEMSSGVSSAWDMVSGNRLARVRWKPEQVRDVLLNFDPKTANQDQVEGICHLLVNHMMTKMGRLVRDPSTGGLTGWFANRWSKTFGANYPVDHPESFAKDLYKICLDNTNNPDPQTRSVVVDKKLRVFETGSHYMFKGGLQMNLNVGQSVSVSRSGSRGAGVDFTDLMNGVIGGALGEMIGGPAAIKYGVIAGFTVKPFSFKAGVSMGDSDGTSISAQTYLVAQIAKFDVELMKYEKCQILRLNPALLKYKLFGFNADDYIGPDTKMQNEQGVPLENLFSRGVMACDGFMTVQPEGHGLKVPEDYYYFTQHFTEGDMLDQADLLNAPWLLQMRGDRDFDAFITAINAQEDVSWTNYGKGAVGKVVRPSDWPLEKLTNTYKTITPSFPGIYTIVPDELKITPFPIGDHVINVDNANDINGEVCNIPARCNPKDQPLVPTVKTR